jgi:hypothetical protein
MSVTQGVWQNRLKSFRLGFAARLLGYLLLLGLPAAVQAQFTYTTNSDGSLNIQLYLGSGGSVTIPSTTNGLPVTSIGIEAFQTSGGSSMTNVIIPNSITSIGYEAFRYCSKLPSITIPDSVTFIDGYPFVGCTSLTNVVLGSGITALFATFDDCTSLNTIAIPDSVTNIGVSTFAGTALNTINIPDSVTTIGEEAFEGCTSLTNVTIGSNVNNLGFGAFYGCTKLTSITIPNSVTAIGNAAFVGCTSLTNVVLGRGVTNIGDASAFHCSNLIAITVDTNNPAFSSVAGVLFDKNQTTLIECPGVGETGSYSIPDTVTNIVAGAFGLCTRLTGIIVGSNNIAYYSLDGVLLDKSRMAIIVYPQAKVGSYIVPNSVTNIGFQLFWNCTAMTSITIPDSVKAIGTNAFYSCTGLTNIVLGNGVTSIGYDAFQNCTSLTIITIPKSVTNIQSYAFEYCTNLMAVYFMGNAPGIGSDLFFNTLGQAFKPNIYYLPGTTGWSVFYAPGGPNLSPILWIPQMLISGAAFEVQTNQFGFTTTGSVGLTEIVVEACTNLFKPVWQPVSTNTLTGGTSYFSDSQWANYPGRFYRLTAP